MEVALDKIQSRQKCINWYGEHCWQCLSLLASVFILFPFKMPHQECCSLLSCYMLVLGEGTANISPNWNCIFFQLLFQGLKMK